MRTSIHRSVHVSRCVRWAALAGLMIVFMASTSAAEQVTYVGLTITDGKIGTWQFHNARVLLTFQSDTANIQSLQVPDPNPSDGSADVLFNGQGDASVTIAADGKFVHAKFSPN